jgi:SAM-dependent methyltransferase
MQNNLTDKKFWSDGYDESQDLVPEKMSYPIVKVLYKNFSKLKNQNKSIFEIGCYPGRFLYHFGKLGFELSGADEMDYLYKMTKWFQKNNFKVGEFIKGDIFNMPITKKFDIVFSSGFIEHFTNTEEIIDTHVNRVADNGYIFITAPNFAGFIQKFLHSHLDSESFKHHHLPAMDYSRWRKYLESKGFEVIDGGYIGGFGFWTASKNIFVRIISKIIRVFFAYNFWPNSKIYSPEIFIIAKKK